MKWKKLLWIVIKLCFKKIKKNYSNLKNFWLKQNLNMENIKIYYKNIFFRFFETFQMKLLSPGLMKSTKQFHSFFGARKQKTQELFFSIHTHLPFPPKNDQSKSKGEQHFLACSATCLCLRCFSWTAFPCIVFRFSFPALFIPFLHFSTYSFSCFPFRLL